MAMINRQSEVDVEAHDELLDYVAKLLDEWEWTIRKDPQVGTVRPDLVAESPDGEAYVFEIKAGADEGHLGTLGQIETFQIALESELGRKPNAVLLLSSDAPNKLQQIADDVGVTILEGFQDDQPALGKLLRESLVDNHQDDGEGNG